MWTYLRDLIGLSTTFYGFKNLVSSWTSSVTIFEITLCEAKISDFRAQRLWCTRFDIDVLFICLQNLFRIRFWQISYLKCMRFFSYSLRIFLVKRKLALLSSIQDKQTCESSGVGVVWTTHNLLVCSCLSKCGLTHWLRLSIDINSTQTEVDLKYW